MVEAEQTISEDANIKLDQRIAGPAAAADANISLILLVLSD